VLAGCDAFAHFPPPLLRPLPRLVRLPGCTALALRALAVPALLADPGPLNTFSRRGLGRPLVADLLAPARTDRQVRADRATASGTPCGPCSHAAVPPTRPARDERYPALRPTAPNSSTGTAEPTSLAAGRHSEQGTTPGSTISSPAKNCSICSGLRRW
jgi:hypothetical protein